ncbi:MAG: hypothetical protein ACRYFX_19645 [Janthinobacterium lividum]
MSNSLPTSPNPNYGQGTETALDRVRASYLQEGGEARLSKSDLVLREQMQATHALLLNYHSPQQAVKILQERFDISQATAYRRLRETTDVFGDVLRPNKEGMRGALYDMSMRVFQLAAAAKDEYNRPAPDLKAMNTAIARMAKLQGLDEKDNNALTPEMLARNTYVVNLTVQGPGGRTKTIPLSGLDQLAEHDPDTYAQLLDSMENSDLTPEQLGGLLDNPHGSKS